MLKTMTLPDSEISGVDDASSATQESRLVDEARRGSRSAFGELVTRYERRLIRVILQFVKSQELAEVWKTLHRKIWKVDKNEEGLDIVKKLKFLGVPEESKKKFQDLQTMAERKS